MAKKKRSVKVEKSAQDRRWERMEREADADIAAGRVSGPYKTAKETIAALHREAGRRPGRKRR